tara:strand:+ start:320 stop:1147 length:828 start_codon:yes stop_codon:yes gene_type:complete
MLNLLSIEYSKVKNYATFWVILIIYAILIPLVAWGISAIHFELPGPPEAGGDEWSGSSLFHFSGVWNTVTWIASWFNILLGILIVLIICNDFNYRTFKQNVIDGLSKKQVIASKFIFLVMLGIAVTLYTFLVSLLFGLIFSESINIFDNVYYVGIYFMQTIGYFTTAFLLAILIKRTALSIVIFVVAFVFKFIFYFALGETISQFFPINLFSDLTPFPLPFLTALIDINPDPEAQKQGMDALDIMISQPVKTMVAAIYIAIFVFISNFILKKRDL